MGLREMENNIFVEFLLRYSFWDYLYRTECMNAIQLMNAELTGIVGSSGINDQPNDGNPSMKYARKL